MIRKHTLLAIFIAIATLPLAAQTMMVKDINPGEANSMADVNVSSKIAIGDVFYFTAFDDTHGMELWKSDGTEEGTVLIKDINPGTEGGNISTFINLNGILLFFADDGEHGRELWKSDGTEAGTQMIKDIRPGSSPGITNVFPHLELIGDLAYFAANDGTNGSELYVTDGTTSGTTLVADIDPGNIGSAPLHLQSMNGILYFSADGGTTIGRELYRSDGTAAGTYLLKDFTTSFTGGLPSSMVAVENTLYFTATSSDFGYELWKSDGTESGTVLVKDLQDGTASAFGSSNNLLFAYGSNLLFVANTSDNVGDLWISDGTEAGTTVLKAFDDGFVARPPLELTLFNDVVYFYAFDDTVGDGLWKTDGTTAGTVLVKEFVGGNATVDRSIRSTENQLLIVARGSTSTGFELWESDGTTDGTNIVQDIFPGFASSAPYNLINVNGKVFFSARTTDFGRELWMYDADVVPLSATIMQTEEILCNGETTAALQIDVLGGAPPYNYQWNDNSINGNNPTDLPAGNYTVTITDNASSSIPLSIEIMEPPALVLNLSSEPATGGLDNGSAAVTISGGTNPYSFLWSTGQTTAQIENLAPAEYSVTITDSNGCTIAESIIVDFVESTLDFAIYDLEIYPSPAKEMIWIKSSYQDRAELRIYNVAGLELLSGIYISQENISIKDLSAGMYFLQIRIGDKFGSQKIIVAD